MNLEFMMASCFGEIRVVVPPPPDHDRTIHELHKGHPEISCMKALARSFAHWPYVKELVKNCDDCIKALDIYHLWLPCNLGNGHKGPGHEFT